MQEEVRPLSVTTYNDVPFKCIAIDIIGPLPCSRSGNKYILMVYDYATRYPEAMVIHSIEAERIAEELIKLCALVGILEEILTDQGSDFTSSLLEKLYRECYMCTQFKLILTIHRQTSLWSGSIRC